MNKEIEKLLDRLIPRGGETPNCIHVSLEEYLSRVSNLNRKLQGVKHRMNCWTELSEEHLKRFDETAGKRFKGDKIDESRITRMSFSLRDTRLENEFEMLLYSISCSLAALTRVIASFIKGSPDFHSHSKLSTLLLRHEEFKNIQETVTKALNSWAEALTERRDAATHYIALSVASSYENFKNNSASAVTISKIGISKKPLKYVSLWEDEVPVIGGAQHTSIVFDNSSEVKEEHKLLDAQNRLIVQRDSQLPKKTELIDGGVFVANLYKDFQGYVEVVLSYLDQHMERKSS